MTISRLTGADPKYYKLRGSNHIWNSLENSGLPYRTFLEKWFGLSCQASLAKHGWQCDVELISGHGSSYRALSNGAFPKHCSIVLEKNGDEGSSFQLLNFVNLLPFENNSKAFQRGIESILNPLLALPEFSSTTLQSAVSIPNQQKNFIPYSYADLLLKRGYSQEEAGKIASEMARQNYRRFIKRLNHFFGVYGQARSKSLPVSLTELLRVQTFNSFNEDYPAMSIEHLSFNDGPGLTSSRLFIETAEPEVKEYSWQLLPYRASFWLNSADWTSFTPGEYSNPLIIKSSNSSLEQTIN
jgi:hypothetical protein